MLQNNKKITISKFPYILNNGKGEIFYREEWITNDGDSGISFNEKMDLTEKWAHIDKQLEYNYKKNNDNDNDNDNDNNNDTFEISTNLEIKLMTYLNVSKIKG
jgi:hypothetical protein